MASIKFKIVKNVPQKLHFQTSLFFNLIVIVKRNHSVSCCAFISAEIGSSTHFQPMFHFYAPWNCQEISNFLIFSGVIKMGHWLKMIWPNQSKMYFMFLTFNFKDNVLWFVQDATSNFRRIMSTIQVLQRNKICAQSEYYRITHVRPIQNKK